MIEIVDIVGEPVKPGSLIAFSKSGQGELQVGIVAEIFSDKLTYFLKSRKKKYQYSQSYYKRTANSNGGRPRRGPAPGRIFLGYGEWKIRKGWVTLLKDKYTQTRLVVIKDPLFLLDNDNIAKQLEIVDMAKDAGYLPQDYEFGQPTEIQLLIPEEDEEDDET